MNLPDPDEFQFGALLVIGCIIGAVLVFIYNAVGRLTL